MTIAQVREDIKAGKADKIYYSSQTAWWTHLASDVIDATNKGIEYRKAIDAKYLADPNVKESDKNRMRQLQKSFVEQNLGHKIPTDPTGAPLFEMDNPTKWMDMSEGAPAGHFGKHGLEAFILTHHQNCTDYFSNKWQGYNDYIDRKIAAGSHLKIEK